jgi:hypothetical protein
LEPAAPPLVAKECVELAVRSDFCLATVVIALLVTIRGSGMAGDLTLSVWRERNLIKGNVLHKATAVPEEAIDAISEKCTSETTPLSAPVLLSVQRT